MELINEKKKMNLFSKEEKEIGFEKITLDISKSRFEKMISNNKLLCPQLTDEKLVTMIIANILFNYFNTGLSKLWEILAMELKTHYGYVAKVGAVNHLVADREEKERKARQFCPSSPAIYL